MSAYLGILEIVENKFALILCCAYSSVAAAKEVGEGGGDHNEKNTKHLFEIYIVYVEQFPMSDYGPSSCRTVYTVGMCKVDQPNCQSTRWKEIHIFVFVSMVEL